MKIKSLEQLGWKISYKDKKEVEYQWGRDGIGCTKWVHFGLIEKVIRTDTENDSGFMFEITQVELKAIHNKANELFKERKRKKK